MFDIDRLLAVVEKESDVDKLTFDELESIISCSPGSITAPEPYFVEYNEFRKAEKLMKSDADPIFIYLFLCRIQKKLLNQILHLSTQAYSRVNLNGFDQLDHILEKITSVLRMLAKIRPCVITSIAQRQARLNCK